VTAPTAVAAATYATYRALDEAYRAEVARQALLVVGGLALYWRSVQAEDLRGTSPDFLERAVDLIVTGQARAQGLANLYAERVRRLAVPDAPAFTPPPARPPNREQIQTSIEFVAIKQTAREIYSLQRSVETPPGAEVDEVESAQRTREGRTEQLMRDAITRAAGSATRYVTTAGHDQVIDNVKADPVALGWARTTKAGCCSFCAVLASRGAVYKEDSFELSDALFVGAGEHKVHDHCGCGLRPIYTEDDPLPDRQAEYEQMWIASGKQKRPGESPLNAFRRMYESSPLAQRAS
jgi:hypothetical protein